MACLILGHRRHEGAHIEGKGQIVDVIVRKLYSHKVVLEVNGVPGVQKVHLSFEQPESELFPDLRIGLSQILGRNYIKIAYLADPKYQIGRRDYYGQTAHLVLDFALNSGARIRGDELTLDVVVREISGPPSNRQGKVEVRTESSSDYLTLVSGEEPRLVREGIALRLSDNQKSGNYLRIVYEIERKYGLRRNNYLPNGDIISNQRGL